MLHSSDLSASSWVQRFASLIPKNGGPVLDLACGSGRHTRLLLTLGYQVWALDKDASLLAPLAQLGARCFQVNLEANSGVDNSAPVVNWPFEPNIFSGIVVTNYLYRPLLPTLSSSLKKGGVLLYETFAAGNEAYGSPRNPDFLLRPGELLRQFLSDSSIENGNHCIAYEHGYTASPRPALVQRICIRSVASDDISEDKL